MGEQEADDHKTMIFNKLLLNDLKNLVVLQKVTRWVLLVTFLTLEGKGPWARVLLNTQNAQ